MCSRQVFANMTQYRVDARNCEAKRLHTEAPARAYVACKFTHVGAARQQKEAVAGTSMD
jgi:hypothetical protein